MSRQYFDFRLGHKQKNQLDCACGHPKTQHGKASSRIKPTLYTHCTRLGCACERYRQAETEAVHVA